VTDWLNRNVFKSLEIESDGAGIMPIEDRKCQLADCSAAEVERWCRFLSTGD